MTNVAAIIPARLGSTRLPRKLLLDETGKPLLQHTWEAASKSRLPTAVWIAVDGHELRDAASEFAKGRIVTTPSSLASGMDRVAYAVSRCHALKGADIVVNVQGDEPEVSGEAIDSAVRLLLDNPTTGMATIAAPILDADRIADPACVKVVFDRQGRALYFSRSPIPHVRNRGIMSFAYQHVGVYAYRRQTLLRLAKETPSDLERVEGLEQLRALWIGEPILVGIVGHASRGIDTEEDYRAFVERWRLGGTTIHGASPAIE